MINKFLFTLLVLSFSVFAEPIQTPILTRDLNHPDGLRECMTNIIKEQSPIKYKDVFIGYGPEFYINNSGIMDETVATYSMVVFPLGSEIPEVLDMLFKTADGSKWTHVLEGDLPGFYANNLQPTVRVANTFPYQLIYTLNLEPCRELFESGATPF